MRLPAHARRRRTGNRPPSAPPSPRPLRRLCSRGIARPPRNPPPLIQMSRGSMGLAFRSLADLTVPNAPRETLDALVQIGRPSLDAETMARILESCTTRHHRPPAACHHAHTPSTVRATSSSTGSTAARSAPPSPALASLTCTALDGPSIKSSALFDFLAPGTPVPPREQTPPATTATTISHQLRTVLFTDVEASTQLTATSKHATSSGATNNSPAGPWPSTAAPRSKPWVTASWPPSLPSPKRSMPPSHAARHQRRLRRKRYTAQDPRRRQRRRADRGRGRPLRHRRHPGRSGDGRGRGRRDPLHQRRTRTRQRPPLPLHRPWRRPPPRLRPRSPLRSRLAPPDLHGPQPHPPATPRRNPPPAHRSSARRDRSPPDPDAPHPPRTAHPSPS